MAGDARDLGMRASQWEIGLSVQGDAFDILKEGRVVAIDASFAQSPLVDVQVTGSAFGGRYLGFVKS
jgi:hypothetical protein